MHDRARNLPAIQTRRSVVAPNEQGTLVRVTVPTPGLRWRTITPTAHNCKRDHRTRPTTHAVPSRAERRARRPLRGRGYTRAGTVRK